MDDDMMMDMEARAQTPLPAAAMAATTSTHPSAAAAAQALDADDATNPGANPFHGQLGEPTNPEAFPVDPTAWPCKERGTCKALYQVVHTPDNRRM